MTIPSWLRGSGGAKIFGSVVLYSQRAVFASPLSAFFCTVFNDITTRWWIFLLLSAATVLRVRRRRYWSRRTDEDVSVWCVCCRWRLYSRLDSLAILAAGAQGRRHDTRSCLTRLRPVVTVNRRWVWIGFTHGFLQHRAGSGVVRIDPLLFLAGCHTRRLNQV